MHRHRKTLFGKCYYCICTACSGSFCPFKHKLYRCCYLCQERRLRSPRLDCDYFQHYIKHRHFRFKRVKAPLSAHFGAYVLITDKTVFVGSWSELDQLRNRCGGQLKKVDFLDFIGGYDLFKMTKK